jgi:hypothetical protein
MSVCTFAGISANQLITQTEHLSMEPSTPFKDDNTTLPTISETEKSPTLRLTSITSADMDGELIIRQLEDVNQQLHFLVKYELTTDPSGRKHAKARKCRLCHIEGRGRKDTMYYCISCGLKSSFAMTLTETASNNMLLKSNRLPDLHQSCSLRFSFMFVGIRGFFEGCRQLASLHLG